LRRRAFTIQRFSFGRLAVYAVSNRREIGVDIEQIRDDLDFLSIASSLCSVGERASLSTLPVDLRARGFYNCWTRKESYIKAQGLGLSLPLDQFKVSLIPGEPAMLLSTSHNISEAGRWRLQELPLNSSKYVASITVEGNDWQARYWRWQHFSQCLR
jgi:4'-phosphopantetheinyl transferase